MMQPMTDNPAGESLGRGHIKFAQDGEFWVAAGPGGLRKAGRAISCLVEPRAGDEVLLWMTPGESYVLAVLARESSGVEVVLPGPAEMTATGGPLTLTGDVALEGAAVRVAARDLEITADRARTRLDDHVHSGSRLQAGVTEIRLASARLTTRVDRFIQRLGSWFRRVDTVEASHSGRRISRVEGLWRVRGKYADMTAEETVRLDGKKINLG